jgi:hypothetical protein
MYAKGRDYVCGENWVRSRVQWFWLISHFEAEQPIPDTLRARGFGIWKKTPFYPWLENFFCKNRKMFFFQSLILGTPFDGSLPCFQHVLLMGSLIYIPKVMSL